VKAKNIQVADKVVQSGTGEDPELLDAGEEALLAAGNAPAQAEATQASQEAETGAREQSESEEPAAGIEERRGLSEEAMRKLGPNDSVPAWSLVKERQEVRELRRKLAAQEEAWKRANERLAQLQERKASGAQASDPEPDRAADPALHQAWQMRQYQRALSELYQHQQAAAQAAAVQHQGNIAWRLEQEYAQNGHPDYYERVKYIKARRARELELIGITDEAERARMVNQDSQMLVSTALRQGRNPAEVAYRLAEEWGYKSAGGSGGSGQEKIRELARKQAAGQSLQAMGGRAAQAPLTLEAIAALDDEAYEKLLEQAGGDLNALLQRG
jgi:hypothetical protein